MNRMFAFSDLFQQQPEPANTDDLKEVAFACGFTVAPAYTTRTLALAVPDPEHLLEVFVARDNTNEYFAATSQYMLPHEFSLFGNQIALSIENLCKMLNHMLTVADDHKYGREHIAAAFLIASQRPHIAGGNGMKWIYPSSFNFFDYLYVQKTYGTRYTPLQLGRMVNHAHNMGELADITQLLDTGAHPSLIYDMFPDIQLTWGDPR